MWQSLPTTTLKPNHGTSRYGCSGPDTSFPANDGTGFDDNSPVDLGGGIDERADRVRAHYQPPCYA